MATESDKKIFKLKEDIKKKKSVLEVKVFKPITNCNLELDGNRYNLHVANKEQLLMLIGKLKSIDNGLKEVLSDETLMIKGYSVEDWIKDLIAKFNNLNVGEEEKRLKLLENKLYKLLSKDTKVDLEIDDLESQI